MNFNEIKQVAQVNQITAEHIQTMRDMLNNGQRAEVYTYYAQLIGNQNPDAVSQLLMQAQITTYSGAYGGAALVKQKEFFAKQNQETSKPENDNFNNQNLLMKSSYELICESRQYK